MAAIHKPDAYMEDIHSCVNTFYVLMRHKRMKELYSMLSPNLQQFTKMVSHHEKFQNVFLFNREIVSYYIHQLIEIYPGLLEAIVLIGLKPVDGCVNPNGIEKVETKKEIVNPDELKYRFYRFRFINIHHHWFIDDVYQDNDFYCTASN
jgi:hypothetical protein